MGIIGERLEGEPEVSFVPNERYVQKNLAPEKSLNAKDVQAIALAAKQAEQSGVLPRDLADHLLPMAMVEGRSGNYGILQSDNNGFYAKPATVDRFKRMGLNIFDTTNPNETQDPNTTHMVARYREGTKDKFIYPHGSGDSFAQARMMAAILAEKAAADKSGTVEGAIKRYNGQGRGIETADGVTQQADVNFYLKKVLEAKRMLEHPANRAMVDLYRSAKGE